MTKTQNSKQYDLEERTFNLAKRAIKFIGKLPKTLTNIEIAKQLVRSVGSIGANYIEANEALSKKDFIMRIKICRKEAKETCYWLRLINLGEENLAEQEALTQEALELTKIFGAIIEKSK